MLDCSGDPLANNTCLGLHTRQCCRLGHANNPEVGLLEQHGGQCCRLASHAN